MDVKGKKAVLYRRVSTTNQKNFGNSLNSQKSQLLKWCATKEVHILEDFEEDHSAKSFKRPAFEELVKYIHDHPRQVDLLLVTKWDRFSRDFYGAEEFERYLDSKGVTVLDISSPIDPLDEYQWLSKVIYRALPEQENRIKSVRVKEGMRQGLRDGRYNNKAPKGYINARDDEGKPLIQPDPACAQLVTDLFEEYAKGQLSQNKLLKDERFKDLKLSKSNLSRMLCNPTYAGKVLIPAYRDEAQQIIDGRHEPLINWRTFRQIQELISGRIRMKQKPGLLNEALPLRGHVKCPNCSSNLTGSRSRSKTGKYHYYYHCNPRKGCNYRLPVEQYHAALNTLLAGLQPPDEIKCVFQGILEDHFKAQDEKHFRRVAKLEKTLTDLMAKKERMIERLIAGELDDKIIQRAIEKNRLRVEGQTGVARQIERRGKWAGGIPRVRDDPSLTPR